MRAVPIKPRDWSDRLERHGSIPWGSTKLGERMKTKETETKYQAYVRVRGTEEWTPVTMWKKPFVVLNQEILNWLVPQLAAKFPENEYKIEEYK